MSQFIGDEQKIVWQKNKREGRNGEKSPTRIEVVNWRSNLDKSRMAQSFIPFSSLFLSLPYFFFPFLTSSLFHPLYPPPLPFPFIPHALTHLSLYFIFFFYFGITSFLNLFPFVAIQCNFLEPSFPFVSTTPWVLYRFPPLHHQNLSRKMNSTVCKHRTKLFPPIGGQLGGNWGWE